MILMLKHFLLPRMARKFTTAFQFISLLTENSKISRLNTLNQKLNNELLSRDDLHRKIPPTLLEQFLKKFTEANGRYAATITQYLKIYQSSNVIITMVLTTLPESYPMELEVKYLETEKDEDDKPFIDVNVYVDTILVTLLPNIGKRKINLLSFSTVITQLLARKQKKVAVKIAVCGETPKYPVYKDIRIRTIGTTIAFAQSEQLLGLSCFCGHIIQNPSIVDEMKRRNLVLSTWGSDNNCEDIREKQRKIGVNVLCFDRILDKLSIQ